MQNTEQERHSWIKLMIILSWLLLYGILAIMGSENNTSLNLDNPTIIALLYVLQLISVLILFVAPALLFAIFWTKPRIHYLGITTKPAMATLLIGSVGIILAQPTINWLADLNQHVHLPTALGGVETWMKNSEAKAAEMTKLFTKGTTVKSLVLNLFVVAFMAALSEELFFRGMLQKVLIESFNNKHVGVWVGAVFFSALHMQFYGFLPRMLMGVYLGYLFVWSGSLWPGMMAHFINNGMAVFLIWLSNRGIISSDMDKIGAEESPPMLIITSIIMVAISLVVVYRTERKRKNIAEAIT